MSNVKVVRNRKNALYNIVYFIVLYETTTVVLWRNYIIITVRTAKNIIERILLPLHHCPETVDRPRPLGTLLATSDELTLAVYVYTFFSALGVRSLLGSNCNLCCCCVCISLAIPPYFCQTTGMFLHIAPQR